MRQKISLVKQRPSWAKAGRNLQSQKVYLVSVLTRINSKSENQENLGVNIKMPEAATVMYTEHRREKFSHPTRAKHTAGKTS